MDIQIRAMNKIKSRLIFLTVGGVGYTVIELLWRGRTHWTMALAGGICFLAFSEIARIFRHKPLLFKAALASFTVTLVELGFGIVVNRIFKIAVWDYSEKRFNILGQICPTYSALWLCLGIIFLPLADFMNKRMGIEESEE